MRGSGSRFWTSRHGAFARADVLGAVLPRYFYQQFGAAAAAQNQPPSRRSDRHRRAASLFPSGEKGREGKGVKPIKGGRQTEK